MPTGFTQLRLTRRSPILVTRLACTRHAGTMPTGTRLVGRDTELARVGGAAARAREGDRATVVIEGAAGIGKSRLLQEVLTVFRDPKDLVSVGHGIELAGGELPYGTISETLRTLVRDAGADIVHTAAGAYVDPLAALCPPLGPAPSSEVDRLQLLPAYVATFENLATDRLVWLVIEDLPWVDASSRDLLSYLVRVAQPSQLLVLITARTNDPDTDPAAGDLVNTLTTLGGVDRLTLRPLSREATATLVADLSAGTASDTHLARVAELSQGSPLLVEQLVAMDLADPSAEPGALARPLMARFQGLESAARRLAQLAALGDGHLTYRLLGQAYDAPKSEFDAAVDQTLASGLLQYHPETRELSFTHALLREAVEDTLTPAARLDKHRRWAEVLSTPSNHHGEERLLIAAAHHWAATDADIETFTSALEAAKVTDHLGAAIQTADLLTRAWHLWDRVPDAAAIAGRSRDDLLRDTCDALAASDRAPEAVALLDHDLIRIDSGPDAIRRLCIRLERNQMLEELGETPSDGMLHAQALQSADALLAAPPSRMLVRALHGLTWHLRWTDPDMSYQLQSHALEVSRALGHPSDLAFSTAMAARHLVGRGRHDEAITVATAGLESAVGVKELQLIETVLGDCLGRAGRYREAASQILKALARLKDPQLSPPEWTFTALRACDWLEALGEWTKVAELYERCATVAVDDWMIGTWVAIDRASLACRRGDLAEAERLSEQAWSRLPPDEESVFQPVRHPMRIARAEVAAARGQYETARQLLEPLLRAPGLETYAVLWPAVTSAASIEGDRAAATGHEAKPAPATLETIRSAAERLPRNGTHFAALHVQAQADLARADHTDSIDTWVEVRDQWRDLGHVPFLGWASLRLATAHAAHDNRAAAAGPLTDAWNIANQLGARPLADTVVDLGRRARVVIDFGKNFSSPPTTGRLARLTEREHEVLRHVIRGESNDEIAETLFISPKTASVHVSRILAKLGVNSRAKATAVALEDGFDANAP
jgi:DNA-binding CsgD family transcriptional regulator/tetratricopeptide (TPR) repeat protein